MSKNAQHIFSIGTEEDFNKQALDVFAFQYKHCNIYKEFCQHLKKNPSNIDHYKKIPFLPVAFFKSHTVVSSLATPQAIFTSSGTTGSSTSKHLVTDLAVYVESFTKGFEIMYEPIENYTILALLPSYLEREGSSLIYMVDHFIKKSNDNLSGFYLHNLDDLIERLETLETQGKKTLLMGVSYALLDLIEKQKLTLKHTIVMETGGMKGQRREMVKEELHNVLKEGFGTQVIHSEYGMTELLSQAYSKGNGLFQCPPWMKILTRDTEDALTLVEGKTGGINIIDLANINSCSFIATQDLGKVNPNGFEIIGRFDHSDIRGCNLMVL